MKKFSVIILLLTLLTSCGKESIPAIESIIETPEISEVFVPEEPEIPVETEQPPEVIMTGGMSVQELIEYFAAMEDFEPTEGFNQRHDDVEYGEYTEVEYFSNTTGNTRKCYVYTPPNYDSEITYPVLYLLHGIGGTHTEWNSGRPNVIISNLISAGEVPPFIAVVPNVRAMYDDNTPSEILGAENIAAFDNFINDLRDDLMPFINETYSVSQLREENAIAGLSMGGREALFIGVSMPETFAYVGAFCPAPGLMNENLGIPGQITPEEMTLPDEFKNNTFIFINTGNQDGVVGNNPINYSNAFRQNGVENVFYSIDGGHDFRVWMNGLYFFVKSIFQII